MGMDQRMVVRYKKEDCEVFPQQEIGRWRNNHFLQKWMYDLWFKKGCGLLEFSSAYMPLLKTDLRKLKSDIIKGKVYPKDYSKYEDLALIERALTLVESGFFVFWESDW